MEGERGKEGEKERGKKEEEGNGGRRREGAPIEMKAPLRKILNTPLLDTFSHLLHNSTYFYVYQREIFSCRTSESRWRRCCS